MKWEVKLYVGGKVFTEEVYASNYRDARETATARNPRAKVIGVNPIVGSWCKERTSCGSGTLSVVLPLFSCIIKESKGFHFMQLTSKRHSMVVEFRPHSILTDKFVYTLKFKDQAQSMRLFNKKEMIETVNSRLDIHGYTVTDFLTEPQQYMPASC